MFKLGPLLLLLSYTIASKANSLVVDLDYAQYQGVYDETTNVTNYHGIRYAAPPTGQFYHGDIDFDSI